MTAYITLTIIVLTQYLPFSLPVIKIAIWQGWGLEKSNWKIEFEFLKKEKKKKAMSNVIREFILCLNRNF